MTVTNRIAANELFLQCVEKNSKYEENRQFCKHGWEHLMDVARIAYIINLERGYGLERDLVYAAGLLHDCGRYVELEQETPPRKGGHPAGKADPAGVRLPGDLDQPDRSGDPGASEGESHLRAGRSFVRGGQAFPSLFPV